MVTFWPFESVNSASCSWTVAGSDTMWLRYQHIFSTASPTQPPTSAPSTPPPHHPASPLLSQARSATDTDEGVEKTHAKKAPLPLSLLHSDNDRLSSHSDQHCHPQHCCAQTHTHVRACKCRHTHIHTQHKHAYTQAYTHTYTGPTAVKIRTSLDNTDNQVTAVTSVIFTLGPDNTSKIPLAMGTTWDHCIKPIRRHVSHQISNYLLFSIPN